MRHEKALQRLDELDRGEEPGFALRLHLASCPSCSEAARRSSAAMASYADSAQIADAREPSTEAALLEDRIMAAVRLTPPPRQDFALRDWLFPPAVLLFSICLVPLASSLGVFETLFEGFAVSFALALTVILTAYSAFFVATHLGELESFLEKRGVTIH